MRYYTKIKFKDDRTIGFGEVIDFLLFFTLFTFLLHGISNIVATNALIFLLSYFSSTSLDCKG